jgi:hypothetical protein
MRKCVTSCTQYTVKDIFNMDETTPRYSARLMCRKHEVHADSQIKDKKERKMIFLVEKVEVCVSWTWEWE